MPGGAIELARAQVVFGADFVAMMTDMQRVQREFQRTAKSMQESAKAVEKSNSSMAHSAINASKSVVRGYTDMQRAASKFLRNMTMTTVFLQLDVQYLTKLMRDLSKATVAGLGLAVGSAAKFEDAFVQVVKVVDMSNVELERLSKNLRQMQLDVNVGADALAEIAAMGGRLGIRGVENLTQFTRTVAELQIATNIVGEEGASQLARFMNIMGTATADVHRLGSAITDLGNNFATTESEILEMALRLAGAGRTVGLTTPQVLGLATAMSAVGLRSEMGGSAMSRVLINMSKAVETNSAALSTFARTAGMSTREFAALFRRDAVGALQAFIRGLQRLDAAGQDVFRVLEDVGASEIRVRDTLLRLFNAADMLGGAIDRSNDAWRDNTALTREVERRNATLLAQAGMLVKAIMEIAREIGDMFVPALKDAVTWTKSVALAFKELSPEQKETIAQTLTLVAAISTAVAVLGSLATIMLTLGVGFLLLARLVVFFTNPWTMLIGALGLGLFLLKQWDIDAAGTIVAWLDSMREKLAALAQFTGPGNNVVENLMTELGTAVASAEQQISELPQLDFVVPVSVAIDRTHAEESWEEFVDWVRTREIPEFPEIKYTAPEFDWTPARTSWEAFNSWISGLEPPEFSEETQAFIDRLTAGVARSPAGQVVVNVGELSQEVMAGEKPLSQALKELVERNIDVPLIAAAISFLPLSRGLKFALATGSLFTPLIPDIVAAAEDFGNKFWTSFLTHAFSPDITLDLDDTLARLFGIEITTAGERSFAAGYKIGHVIGSAISHVIALAVATVGELMDWVNIEISAELLAMDFVVPFLEGFGRGLIKGGKDAFVELINRFVYGGLDEAQRRGAVGLRVMQFAESMTKMAETGEQSWYAKLFGGDDAIKAANDLMEIARTVQLLKIEGDELNDVVADINASLAQMPVDVIDRLVSKLSSADLANLHRILPGLALPGATLTLTIPGYREGALLPGLGGSDQFLAMLAPGEAVVPAQAVRGGWPATLRWFREQGVPGFQEGFAPEIAAAQAAAQAQEAEVQALAAQMKESADTLVKGMGEFNERIVSGIMTGIEFLARGLKLMFPDRQEQIDAFTSAVREALSGAWIKAADPAAEAIENALRAQFTEGFPGFEPGGPLRELTAQEQRIREFDEALTRLSMLVANFDKLVVADLQAFAMETRKTALVYTGMSHVAEWTAAILDYLGNVAREAGRDLQRFSAGIQSSLERISAVLTRYGVPAGQDFARAANIAGLITDLNKVVGELGFEFAAIRDAAEEFFGGGFWGKLGGLAVGGYVGSQLGGAFRDTGTGVNWIGSIAGTLAGMGIATPITGAIALGSQIVNALAPGKPKDPADQALQQRIKDMNKELKEWGATFQSENLWFEKDVGILGWRNLFGNVKWETINKEAAEKGAEIAERLLASMKNIFGALSPLVGQALFGGLTEGEFIANVGMQIQDAFVQALLAEGPVKEQLQQLSAMVAEAIEFGMTDDAMEDIKEKAKEAFEAIEEFQHIADEIAAAFGTGSDAIGQIVNRLRDQLQSAVESAFRAATLAEFTDEVKRQLLLKTRDAFVQAFMESAAMAPLFDALSSAIGDAVRDGIIEAGEMEAIRDIISQISEGSAEFFIILEELGLSMKDLAGTAKGVSEALVNVPEGFRVALHRYHAMDPMSSWSEPSIVSVEPLPFAQTGGYVTQSGAVFVHAGEIIHNPERGDFGRNNITMNVTIVSNDPQKIYRELKKLMERENVVRYGTPVAPAPRFSR